MRSILRPINFRSSALSISLVLPLLAGGCISSKTVLNKYYIIELEQPGPSVAENEENRAPVIDMNCEITEIEVSSLIDRSQIINRSRSHEITYYQSHLWATRPSVAFADVLLRKIEGSGLFRGVSDRYSRTLPDLRLGSAIRHLEVVEEDGDLMARLSMEFSLVRSRDNQVMVTHRFDRTEPLEKRDLNLFAQKISQILSEELNLLIAILKEEAPDIQETPEGSD